MKFYYFGLAALCPALMLAQYSPSTTEGSDPLDFSGKLNYHFQKVYGPISLLESGLQAALMQRNDDPREWREGARGLWRRTASTVGYDTIRNSFMFSLNSVTRADPRYFRSGEGPVYGRAAYAF